MNKEKNYKRDRIFLQVLKSMRTGGRVTQKEMASKLRVTQSYLSKIERGERGINMLELMDYCEAAGISLTQFAARLEWKLSLEYTHDKKKTDLFSNILSFFHLS